MIESILKSLNTINKDKYQHATLGSLIFVIMVGTFLLFGMCADLACLVSYNIMLLIAVGKETYDSFSKHHTADTYDILYTMLIPSVTVILYYMNIN